MKANWKKKIDQCIAFIFIGSQSGSFDELKYYFYSTYRLSVLTIISSSNAIDTDVYVVFCHRPYY